MSEEQEGQVEELEQQDGIETQETQETQETKPDASAELRAAMTELAGTVKTLATPKTEEKPLTEDEKNEFWAVYNPEKEDPDFFKKWMRLQDDMDPQQRDSTVAERKKLFASMQKGLTRQAVVGSKNLFEAELAKRDEQIKELTSFVQEQKAEKTRTKFFSAYPGLKDDKFSKIIAAQAQMIANQNFESEGKYFKALAEGAAETIKAVVPEFDLGAGKTEKQKPAGNTSRLPRTSAGGTGGSGAGPGMVKSTPKGGDIDDLD